MDTAFPATATNETKKKRAQRNRRMVKHFSDEKIRQVKNDFDLRRNSLEVGQDHLLPRAEAVDGVLIRHSYDIASVRAELSDLRRQLGFGSSPFLVRRTA